MRLEERHVEVLRLIKQNPDQRHMLTPVIKEGERAKLPRLAIRMTTRIGMLIAR